MFDLKAHYDSYFVRECVDNQSYNAFYVCLLILYNIRYFSIKLDQSKQSKTSKTSFQTFNQKRHFLLLLKGTKCSLCQKLISGFDRILLFLYDAEHVFRITNHILTALNVNVNQF